MITTNRTWCELPADIHDVARVMNAALEKDWIRISRKSQLFLREDVSQAADKVVGKILKRECTGDDDNDWYGVKEAVCELAFDWGWERGSNSQFSNWRNFNRISND